ncbi:MAG: hypothetical protein RLZZ416_112 [Candidatus Parcubacteria bacterium]|jgi:hypothetical protein
MRIGVALFALCLIAGMPALARGDVANFTFASDPQAVAPGATSEQITIQAQDSSGAKTSVPQTACVALTSSSSQGQFSSSAASWSPISVLTMSKNTANRSFYYRDSQTGSFTLTAKVALKPESVSASCANWPQEEWGAGWTTTQSIGVGESLTRNSGGDQSQSPQSQGASQSPSSAVSSYVAPPSAELFADAGPDRAVIVGADTEFDGRAYDKKKEPVENVRFLWNFGDGSTAEGEAVSHHYDYPGRYAVVLNIAQNKTAVSDVVIVTAEPAMLGFLALPDGSVSIENKGAHDLDLSSWIVRQGARQFLLPEHSVVLQGAAMHVSQRTLGFASDSSVQLQYPNGVAAFRAGEAITLEESSIPQAALAPEVISNPAVVSEPGVQHPVQAVRAMNDNIESPEDPPQEAASADPPLPSENIGAAATATGDSSVWWGAAITLTLIAAISLLVSKHLSKKEWEIMEEK